MRVSYLRSRSCVCVFRICVILFNAILSVISVIDYSSAEDCKLSLELVCNLRRLIMKLFFIYKPLIKAHTSAHMLGLYIYYPIRVELKRKTSEKLHTREN